jgi:hypothetical protein
MAAILNALSRAALIWLLLMFAESLQGAARHLLVSPALQQAFRQLSVMVGVVVIFAITWGFMPWMRIRSARQALAIGALWALFTLAFEFGVGRIMGATWSRILADYDLTRGGFMPLGLFAMALTPWIVWRLQARRHQDALRSDSRLGKPD